jgi:hypothetical protein
MCSEDEIHDLRAPMNTTDGSSESNKTYTISRIWDWEIAGDFVREMDQRAAPPFLQV